MHSLKRSIYSSSCRLLHATPSEDAIRQLEISGARILRATQRLVEKRQGLISLMQKETSANPSTVITWSKDIKELEPVQTAWNGWVAAKKSLRDVLPLLHDPDPDMRSLASEEYDSLRQALSHYINTVFPHLVLPPSTTAHLSTIVEFRTGVGGTEASLFLADLLRMYRRLANSKNWPSDIISCNDNEGGGIKAAVLEIQGAGSYDTLRWESGVHRVQRVPETEASGRTHTSTVAVVVLPSSEDDTKSQDGDIDLDLNDIKVEVMRSRGAGGQHVNKTESAVRLTHLPTGTTVSIQDERSQHQNKRRAFQILRARLLDMKLTREAAEQRAMRNNLVKTADRNQKIRTYNFSKGRVTDHRVGLTFMNLMSILEGNGLEEIHEALNNSHRLAMIEGMGNSIECH